MANNNDTPKTPPPPPPSRPNVEALFAEFRHVDNPRPNKQD